MRQGIFASFVLSTASWISPFQNKQLFKLPMVGNIDDINNTINNDSIDSAVKQKIP